MFNSRTAVSCLCITGILFAVGIGCEMVGDADPPEPDRPLVGPIWHLVAFEAADGSRTSVDHKYDRPRGDSLLPYYSLRFTETSVPDCGTDDAGETQCRRINAQGYPNQGYFSYKAENDRELQIHFNGTTLIGQFPGSKETKFFKALDAVTDYSIDGARLRLAYGDDKVLLFEVLSTEEH